MARQVGDLGSHTVMNKKRPTLHRIVWANFRLAISLLMVGALVHLGLSKLYNPVLIGCLIAGTFTLVPLAFRQGDYGVIWWQLRSLATWLTFQIYSTVTSASSQERGAAGTDEEIEELGDEVMEE